jgi:Xaa-Pro aminopeptidase
MGKSYSKPMAFTIEPGVYLSGKRGIRVEDDVLTTYGGCEVLTGKLRKRLGWWANTRF